MRFVALLRGINVGGNNVIRMADLKRLFETLGFEDVSTFIASGNVLFSAPRGSHERRIEKALSEEFGYEARVLVRSTSQIRKTLEKAPKGWPRADTRCYVVFVKSPLTPARALRVAPPRAGVDTVVAAPGALLYGTRKDALTRSGLQKALVTPEYKRMTIRTFATCAKILDLLERPRGGAARSRGAPRRSVPGTR